MKKLILFSSLLYMGITFSSCKKDTMPELSASNSSVVNSTSGKLVCGTPLTADLLNYGLPGGSVSISNDDVNVSITITTSDASFKLKTIKVAYGTLAHLTNDISYSFSNLIGMDNPDISADVIPSANTSTVTIPLSSFGSCSNLVVFAYASDEVNPANDYGMWIYPNMVINSYAWSSYVNYCVQSCPPPPPPSCGQLRTQTPGGWGAPVAGNNPGAYLHANFAGAFPAGLNVGCYPNNFYIRFTNAQAITDLLPASGTPRALTMNYLNPTNPAAIKNTLMNHVVALSLSVGFDNYDVNFGAGSNTLSNMIIGSGSFSGMSVGSFLGIANNVLGGCSTLYTPSQVLQTAAAINENYVDGTINNGFLVCP